MKPTRRSEAMYETAATQATTSARRRARSTPAATARAGRASRAARRAPSTRAAAASDHCSTRPIGATVARQIPVLKVTCSNHVSVTRAKWSRTHGPHTQVPHAPRVGRAPGPGHVRRGGRRRQDGGQAEGRDHPRGHHGRGDAVLGSPSVLNTTFYLASPAPSTGTSWSWPSTTTTPRPPSTRSAGASGAVP